MSHSHLNTRERMSLFYLLQMNLSFREIGRRLNRSHTTISREVERNKRRFGCYCDKTAQQFADQRKALPRHQRRFLNKKLVKYVFERLALGWSPEIISNRLKRDYPYSKKTMRMSPETIYQWVIQDAVKGGNTYTYLVRAHKKRRKQRRYASLRGKIPHRVDIEKRPAIVDKRKRYGDWEGDTMVGHRHQGRLVTQVERKSRYLLCKKIDSGTAADFNEANISLFEAIPEKYRLTMTLDNGSENSHFKELEDTLSLRVYFAKPYASYERGTNENTNGLIRRYFPKGTNFLKIKDTELEKVIELLNHRPRKCLNYRTPFEVFNKITGGAF